MEGKAERELALLERRSRTLSGAVLAVTGFLATYGLMLFEGQIDRPGFHFYPWFAALLLFFAGDLWTMIWFRVVARQLAIILRNRQTEEEPLPIPPPAPPPSEDQVEVIRPSRIGG